MPRCRRPFLCWIRLGHMALVAVLIALLFSQSLGLLHRIAHPFAVEQQRSPDEVQNVDGAKPLDRLFAGHATHSVCLAFDQISHSSPVPATLALDCPLPPRPVAPLHALAGRPLSAASVPFQARGPPHSS